MTIQAIPISNKKPLTHVSAPQALDYQQNLCYNIHTQNTTSQHREELLRMADRDIKASLQEDRGTYVVRGRVFDAETGKYKNKSKSTGIKVKPGNKRKAESQLKIIVQQWQEEQSKSVRRNVYPPISELIEAWLQRQKVSVMESSFVTCQSHAARICEEFGDVLICDLTRKMVQDYVDRMMVDHCRGTVFHYLSPLRSVVRYAIIDNIISADPLQYVQIPNKKPKEQPVLNTEEINTLLDIVIDSKDYTMYAVIMLAGVYGLRREEVCGLRWIDVDFASNEIQIRHVRTQVSGYIFERDGAKTDTGLRRIKLTNNTMAFLKSLMEYQTSLGIPLDKVCCQKNGKPLVPNTISIQVANLLNRNGMEGHLHTLRHSAATIMSRELTVKQLQSFLGHSSPGMSLHYVHLSNEDADIISEALEKTSRNYQAYAINA